LTVPSSSPVFRPLAGLGAVRAVFLPRLADVDVDTDRSTALSRLAPHHRELLAAAELDPDRLATGEQVHGDGVAIVTEPGTHPAVDGLITAQKGLVLGIYVADCAAVYLADRRGRAAGLIHSGRAGTSLNITGRAITLLRENFGVAPSDLVVHLSPCIRPPLYETDFAAQIVAQARAAGVNEVIDDGICTGAGVGHYYSYRVERGRTGRMLAALSLVP